MLYDMTIYLDNCECETYYAREKRDCKKTVDFFRKQLKKRFSYDICKTILSAQIAGNNKK